MKKYKIIIILCMSLIALSANSKSVSNTCDNVEDCDNLKGLNELRQKTVAYLAQIDTKILSIVNKRINLAPIVNKDESTKEYCSASKLGEICKMSFDSALKYCKSQMTRLPTARELAIFAMENGAKGLIEVSTQIEMKANGESVTEYSNIDVKEFPFYYNQEGYYRKDEDTKNKSFWSSSESTANSTYAYFLEDRDGLIEATLKMNSKVAGVRCAILPMHN